MTPIKRPLAAAGAAVLLALSLSACGGGAPTDASAKDFCEALLDNEDSADVEEDDYEGQAEALKKYAEKVEEVGTPEDIPDDARKGFEFYLDVYGDINADDIEEAQKKDSDIEDEFEDKLKDNKKEVDAFNEYQAKTCADQIQDSIDAPDSAPSVDTPSIDPSDIPSIDPDSLPSLDPEQQESLEAELEKLEESLAPSE